MYCKLENKEMEVIKKASQITFTDYELINEFIPVESLISMVEDLVVEIDNLKEKYEDLEEDLRDNYTHKPMSHYTGNREDDRY